MSMEMTDYERILKVIKKCQRRRNIPDLHSFTIEIVNGFVFVECGHGKMIFIDAKVLTEDGNEISEFLKGSAEDIAQWLVEKGAYVDTITQ